MLQVAATEAQEVQRRPEALTAEADELQESCAAWIRQLRQVSP